MTPTSYETAAEVRCDWRNGLPRQPLRDFGSVFDGAYARAELVKERQQILVFSARNLQSIKASDSRVPDGTVVWLLRLLLDFFGAQLLALSLLALGPLLQSGLWQANDEIVEDVIEALGLADLRGGPPLLKS
jgi:hypothetical protein